MSPRSWDAVAEETVRCAAADVDFAADGSPDMEVEFFGMTIPVEGWPKINISVSIDGSAIFKKDTT